MSITTKTAPSQDLTAASVGTSPTTTGSLQGLTVYDALLIAMVATWGANPAAIKWALRFMDPLVFNAFRFLLAAIVPVLLVLLSKERLTWHRGDGWKLLALGLVAHGVYQIIFILGLDSTL